MKSFKPKKDKKKKKSYAYSQFYSLWDDVEEEEQVVVEQKDESQYFVVLSDPTKLLHLDIIWSIVLQSEVEEVYVPAINLLVYSQLNVEPAKFSAEVRSGYVR